MAVEWPKARLGHIIRHAEIRVLLSGIERARDWPTLAGSDSPIEYIVYMNGAINETSDAINATILGPEDVVRQSDSPPEVRAEDDDIAYLLYTSGSTGSPKGVMLSHRNALSFVDWTVREFALTKEDRLSNHAPLHFDLAVFDIFAAARAAATVVLIPRSVAVFPTELTAFVRAKDITVWYSVPSAVNILTAKSALKAGGLPKLRLVLFAGEVFPIAQLRQAMAVLPGAVFYNLYGPTETNVCTFHRVLRPLPEELPSIPIGIPIGGVELFCRTDEDYVPGRNRRGELLVHGATVMQGYLGEPEQTAKVLVAPDPARPEIIAYCTGDIVTQDERGEWHFIGRRDSQIKSRGYRIELGEIEAALNAHPLVAECAVVPVPDRKFGNLIKAHVVTSEKLSVPDLRTYLRQVLPAYMVPWSFSILEALPRTSTGKIDYQTLNSRDTEDELDKPHGGD